MKTGHQMMMIVKVLPLRTGLTVKRLEGRARPQESKRQVAGGEALQRTDELRTNPARKPIIGSASTRTIPARIARREVITKMIVGSPIRISDPTGQSASPRNSWSMIFNATTPRISISRNQIT
ncbi:hypothetical protein FOVG_18597 [Fusarium oxysporum f. sp. pisi HDV247]|uniref:Uncharacterized protein n=1 Tax=Fusarium oxysporum f. sp. pisi HDV247 TaxID=1080344 RepID=W9NQ53_FUSOX|nr:hypothetical protein FOVG_18597 [Fusarium oxysporum f. sp. pisi HDV247]